MSGPEKYRVEIGNERHDEIRPAAGPMLDEATLHDRSMQPNGCLEGTQERLRVPRPPAFESRVIHIHRLDTGR